MRSSRFNFKTLIFLTVIFAYFILLPSGCSRPADKSFFPCEKGYSWVYRGSDGTGSAMTVKGTEEISQELAVQLFTSCFFDAGGEAVGTSEVYYRLSDSGLYYHGTPSYSINPGLTVLKFPLKEGQSWTVSTHGRYSSVARVARAEKITVPAGTFDCYLVSYVNKRGTIETHSTNIWFGKGAGIVKTAFSSSTIESELVDKNF